jgi:ubiquinone/menaquinone biosynthesis C-methylase UbiE
VVGPVETFQIPLEIAEMYEARFVPRLFALWAPHLVEAARVAPGQSVLDVACGTGIVARTVAGRLGGRGRVVGVDLNRNMLAVASQHAEDIEWREGDAQDLPFDDDQFDAVLCQSGLMFFPDPTRAIREMARVAKPDGVVAVQVWASLESQPAYSRLVEIAARHAGPDAVNLLGAYWSCGDLDRLRSQFEAADLDVSTVRTLTEVATFDSVDELVATEVESTPLIERITSEVYDRIREDAREALAKFRTDDGVRIPLVGHVIAAHGR